jgi:LysR family transcriptional regulator, transcriptional activator of nhaA
MNPWINYHHLYYFKVIAEEGTVSKAALKLRLGQPTLSAQLKQFEDNLDVQLFERHHKKLVLTEQGRVALEYAQNIFRMGSEMFEVLHDRIRPLKPSLHVGALDSISKRIVVQLTKHAFSISPCQITLSEGKLDELIRDLTAHKVDLILTNHLPSGLDAKLLYPKSIAKNGVVIFGAKCFRHLSKGFPKSIAQVPIIFPTFDSKLRQDLEHWGKVNDIEFNIVVETQDIAVKKLMAVGAIGLIPTAKHSVIENELRGELFEIGTLDGVWEELYLVSAQRKIKNQIAAALMDFFSI